jgi:hypothetical protein
VNDAEDEIPKENDRDQVVDYLSTAFTPPDRIAGELLLLALLSAPTSRPTGLPPLGTITLNFIQPGPSFMRVIQSVMPRVVDIAMDMSVLHDTRFAPCSDGSELQAGKLQLAPGTVVVVREELGEGGVLEGRALKNLQDLGHVISDQTLRYDYPYMEDLKIDCALRVIVCSEGKSILPVCRQVGWS